jgi:hypothetical protein
MTRAEAEALARKILAVTGHEARAEFEDDECGFVVLVPVARPRSGAIREEYRLEDELDWEYMRDRITSA